jgi:PAS domain S-box-containing protein
MSADRFTAILDQIPAARLYRALIESNVVGVTITGETELHAANDAFLDIVGRTKSDLDAGLAWTDISSPDTVEADEAALRRLRTEGVAGPFEKTYLRPDGTEVPVLLSGMRIQEEPLLVMATIYDLSERQQVEQEMAALYERERDARFAAELASARIGRLQEITAGLSASRSPDEIARVMVHHAIEDLSASAGLLTRLEGAELVVSHAIGYQRIKLEEWRRFPLAISSPLTDAIRERRPVALGSAHEWGERYPAIRGGQEFAGIVAIGLFSGDRPLGGMALSFREERTLDPDDLEFLISLASQASTAMERALLFENRAYVAHKLQEGLLPDELARIPGVETAVRYRSISGGGEVGGDFYDVFEAGPGRWALAVGDVCGKGTEAAVVTGLARHTVRALAWVKEGPADVLAFLNDALRRHAAVPSFCTVGCGIVRADGDEFTVQLASGGHPYPILLRAGGGLEQVRVTGTMLGVADDPELEEVSVRLAPGDSLVMYTDGVIDARRPGGALFGEPRLLEVLRGVDGHTADQIAGAIDDAVTEHAPDAPADDRAVVVLQALGAARTSA